MIKKTYHIAQMDCPSEEALIRIKLEEIAEVSVLNFDLDKRMLEVLQTGENAEIEKQLNSLNLGCELKGIEHVETPESIAAPARERRMLWWVLGINLSFFVIEMASGIISKSMGLIADSLDMLADSVVYGLSLWAVGSAIRRKKKVAVISGYFQIALAALGFTEILRRVFFTTESPDYRVMIIVSLSALAANAVTMLILNKSKSKDAHIAATKIFTSNDIIINLGVVVAGLAVMFTGSPIPDLVVGAIVFLIVIRGAVRILKLGRD